MIVPASVEDIPPMTAMPTTTASNGIKPFLLREEERVLLFGGSENFKISTFVVSFARVLRGSEVFPLPPSKHHLGGESRWHGEALPSDSA